MTDRRKTKHFKTHAHGKFFYLFRLKESYPEFSECSFEISRDNLSLFRYYLVNQ